MHFDIIHELDAPLDTIERAVLSPELGARLGARLTSMESVTLAEHQPTAGGLLRVLEFQANAPLGLFKSSDIAREAMFWAERWAYRAADHEASWEVLPRPQYRRYFEGRGSYRLEGLPGGRTRRTASGDFTIHARLVGALAARLALAEIRKTYDAEADVLRALATEALGS